MLDSCVDMFIIEFVSIKRHVVAFNGWWLIFVDTILEEYRRLGKGRISLLIDTLMMYRTRISNVSRVHQQRLIATFSKTYQKNYKRFGEYKNCRISEKYRHYIQKNDKYKA